MTGTSSVAEVGALRAFATQVGAWAMEALLREVELTPKPGLVDQRNSGAHDDMDMDTFLASIRAIGPWFTAFTDAGAAGAHLAPSAFLASLRPQGLACEAAMFHATGGVNTHKGGIFSLGLLCAVVGRLAAQGVSLDPEEISRETALLCADLTAELRVVTVPRTAGERLYLAHGLLGIRGEAASGYVTVMEHGLPVLESLRLAGCPEEEALLQVLLHLMAENADTNVVSRGGMEGLHHVRTVARELLQAGGIQAPDILARLEAFDDDLRQRHLSPGGSADLLAVTWFLAQFR